MAKALSEHLHHARHNPEVVAKIGSQHILLETDAPYFPPSKTQSSTPYCLGMIAQELASFRGCEWRELLEISRSNAYRLYWNKSGPASPE